MSVEKNGCASPFTFRVTGIEYGPNRSYDRRYEDEFVISAENVGDALNELVNRSELWETLDPERPFTIEVVAQSETPTYRGLCGKTDCDPSCEVCA